MTSLRKRLALWLCRAAGLTEVAAHRAELDDLRESNRKLEAGYSALLKIAQATAGQTNSNTLMLKRWLEASPNLQTVERAHATRGTRTKGGLILPPSADLRAFVQAE
jgi:hypothetical protein